MSTKKKFFKLLESKQGEVLSGEDAAAFLGVSRNAVWKAANSLRKDGVEIDASSGGGYRLVGTASYFSKEAIEAWLKGDYPVKFFDMVDSTNNSGRLWAIEAAPHGSVVAAKEQKGGKGRLGRSFSSPPGGLYMSVILRPGAEVENPALITTAAAVAVCRAVQKLCGISLSIKWVNDVFYKGKKVCGILTEGVAGLENNKMEYMVCGIGINYTTKENAFSKDAAKVAASLYPNGGEAVSIAQLIGEIHSTLMEFANNLGEKSFLEEYRERSFLIGKRIKVLAKGSYSAIVKEIDDEARLVVERDDGAIEHLSSGEVSVIEDIKQNKGTA